MLANKKQRARFQTLKKRADFLSIQNSGLKWVSHGLVIQAKRRDSDKPSDLLASGDMRDMQDRVGFTVTKKIDKSAVKRNRMKRRLRAIAAEVLSRHAKTGYDYILVGRPQTATRDYGVLRKDLIWCLKKMDLYTDLEQPIPSENQRESGHKPRVEHSQETKG